MIIRSYRFARFAALNSGPKPSFSMNNTADTSRWPDDVEVRVRKSCRDDFWFRHRLQITTDLHRPDADPAIGVRLLKVAAGVVHDIPADLVFLEICLHRPGQL